MLREKNKDRGQASARPKMSTRVRDRRVQIVRVLLESSFDRKLGLREMGAQVNLSPWRLAHLFKSETGMSPQRYLTLVRDRKSTRLNSSHDQISYAVFCLKKKKRMHTPNNTRLRSSPLGISLDDVHQ